MSASKEQRRKARERRKELTKRVFKGEDLSNEIAPDLAEKYDMNEHSVVDEWSKRSQWMEEAFYIETETSKDFIMELVAEQKLVKEAGWRLFEEANNPNTRLGSLKMISSINKDVLEILSEAGLIELDAQSDALKDTLDKMDKAIQEKRDEIDE